MAEDWNDGERETGRAKEGVKRQSKEIKRVKTEYRMCVLAKLLRMEGISHGVEYITCTLVPK